ncbi:very short patch repair endonuclease [Crossiella sp. SN42]|nr:very short patch repair endonuclease [Crossiella sp. SN42]
MRANKSFDTKPEIRLRKALYALGLRYRVCARPLPEVRRTVDVVFRPAKVAVELRGCFWHGCPDHYRAPKANNQYWADKVRRNVERDLDTERRLAEAGWLLEVVWEHEDLEQAAERVAVSVLARRGSAS